ncbi:MAG: phosphatase PAP2 family protein [Bacteroidota bacterium]|nr:phosphatase PAP2 family protein [Bacteroidota bacterium]
MFLINLFSKEIKLIYFLIIYSLFVAYSRIYLGVHYPLDVLFGIGVGFFYGFSISVISKKLFFKFNNFRI